MTLSRVQELFQRANNLDLISEEEMEICNRDMNTLVKKSNYVDELVNELLVTSNQEGKNRINKKLWGDKKRRGDPRALFNQCKKLRKKLNIYGANTGDLSSKVKKYELEFVYSNRSFLKMLNNRTN